MKPQRRWNGGYGYVGNPHFWSAIQKYGWENISHEIVCDGLTRELAFSVEKDLIASFHSTDPSFGYNVTSGGDGGASGVKISEETRKRKSESAKIAWDKRGRKRIVRKQEKGANPGRKKRKVMQFTLDGLFVKEWESLASIEKELGIPWRGVQLSCNNRNRTCHGYAWVFSEGCV